MLSVVDIGIQRAAQTSERLSKLFGAVQQPDGTTTLRCVGTSVASLLAGRCDPAVITNSHPSPHQEQCVPLGFTKTIDRAMKGGIPVGTVAEITGPSGVGKTRLVHHIAAANAVRSPPFPLEDHHQHGGGSESTTTTPSSSSRVLIVDADGASAEQASSLLSMVQFMALDRADGGDHDTCTANALDTIHIMNLRDGGASNSNQLLPTVKRQSMAAFIKSLYRHASSNPLCKLILIDSFTALLDNIEFPKPTTTATVTTAPRARNSSFSSATTPFNTSGANRGVDSSSRLLDTQTLLQELKQLSEIFRCAVIIITHASPYSSGPEINRHSGGLTMFHAVNTRMVIQWQSSSSGPSAVCGQPTMLPSINNLKGLQQQTSNGDNTAAAPVRVFTVTKSPICPTPMHFALQTQDQGRGNVHDPTLVATTAPLRTT